jgi:hypothetical protein
MASHTAIFVITLVIVVGGMMLAAISMWVTGL